MLKSFQFFSFSHNLLPICQKILSAILSTCIQNMTIYTSSSPPTTLGPNHQNRLPRLLRYYPNSSLCSHFCLSSDSFQHSSKSNLFKMSYRSLFLPMAPYLSQSKSQDPYNGFKILHHLSYFLSPGEPDLLPSFKFTSF